MKKNNMKQSDPPIIVEQILPANIKTVWTAITEVEEMTRWYFDNIPSFEPEVGFETGFIVSTGERSFPHLWKVIEVEVNRKISYNWKYEGYEGDSNVHFELFPSGDETLLRLTTEVLEDFQSDIPEFKRESCVDAWKYFVKESLPKYLAKKN